MNRGRYLDGLDQDDSLPGIPHSFRHPSWRRQQQDDTMAIAGLALGLACSLGLWGVILAILIASGVVACPHFPPL